MKKEEKSLGMNAILNGLKNLMSIIFPLITFPYVSKVLQVDNIGKYNFAFSIVTYFIMIAGLGIPTYAIREGARYRNDNTRITSFASQIFTINLVTMSISYLLLGVLVISVPKIRDYYILILIFSIEIFFRTIGMEWLLSVYEEYAFITKRTIIFQVLSIIFMFVFVRDSNDYYKYAFITVIANAGNNLLNVFYAKKFCNVRVVKTVDWKKHLRPILIIFSTSVAITVYVSSDVTILGFLTSDYHVGLYSVSGKIYKIVKTLLSSILIVSIPRLSNYLGTDQREKYQDTLNHIFNVMVIVVIPAVVGLALLSKEVVLIVADETYLEATKSLQILCVALIFSLFGWLYNSCVLIPYKMESKVLVATIAGAVVNIAMNFLLIPFFKQDAAAFTTLIAEAITMAIQIFYSRGLVHLNGVIRNCFTVVTGCFGIFSVITLLRKLQLGTVSFTVLAIAVSVIVYFVLLRVLNNPFLEAGIKIVLKKKR